MRIDDIAGQFGIAFGLPFSRVPFHPEVLALDVAKATWLLEKSAVTRWTAHAYFADFGRRENDSDPLHLRRLLRSGREWPRSRSTKCRDEIAPSHLTRPRWCPAHCPNLQQPRTCGEGQMASAQFKTLARSMLEMGHSRRRRPSAGSAMSAMHQSEFGCALMSPRPSRALRPPAPALRVRSARPNVRHPEQS